MYTCITNYGCLEISIINFLTSLTTHFKGGDKSLITYIEVSVDLIVMEIDTYTELAVFVLVELLRN
jgi:hypothetical protein